MNKRLSVKITKKDSGKFLRVVAFFLNWDMLQGLISNLLLLNGITNIDFIFGPIYRTLLSLILIYFYVKIFLIIQSKVKLIILCTFFLSTLLFSVIANYSGIYKDLYDLIRIFICYLITYTLVIGGIDFVKFKELIINLKPYTYFAVIYAMTQIMLAKNGGKYSMLFSYNIVIPTILTLFLCFAEIKIRYVVMGLFLIAATIYCGAKGSLLCYAIALLLLFAIYIKKPKVKVAFFLLSMMVVVLAISFDDILYHLSVLTGRRSYVLETLIQGNFGTSRGVIYDFVLEEIKSNPLKIRGFYSDRVALRLFLDEKTVLGVYPHNFILEVLYQFGIWVIPFLLFLLYRFIRVFKYCCLKNDDGVRGMTVISTAYAVGQLAFSGSYLTTASFALFVGILVSVNGSTKEYKK